MDLTQYIVPILQIIWIDLLLSGDNAVVIALACRGLPPAQRRIGILLGAGAAVGLRVAFTGVTSTLIGIPGLKLVSGLLLFWIAIKLLTEEDEGHGEIKEADNLWKAVWTIVVADVVMSLDNVIAITAAAKGAWSLIIFGLVLSIPLVIWGSQLVLALISRFPAIVWAGAALLGWIAGEIMIADVLVPESIQKGPLHYVAPVAGVLIVLGAGWLFRRRSAAAEG